MLYADDGTGERIEPYPSGRAACPLCAGVIRARCGQVNIWHWAHVSGGDCDSWSEPETDWHRAYQRIVPADRREVPMGTHRADLVSANGAVVELQHSSLSDEIAAREAHYGAMNWLFDAREAYWSNRLILRPGRDDSYVSFRWKQPRRSITYCARPVLLDLGQGQVLHVKKIYAGPPCGGWATSTRPWTSGDGSPPASGHIPRSSTGTAYPICRN
ncbi:competence protein CoiA family protein [Streptomyces sp. SBT349]|uniref:competence protein CoiA family protein n=1 Tax=Streptomyces sp. SBT349 TaxID=1580539 RepID=UPI000D14BA0C